MFLAYLLVQGVVGTLKDPSITNWRETAGEAGAHVVRILPGHRRICETAVVSRMRVRGFES